MFQQIMAIHPPGIPRSHKMQRFSDLEGERP